MCIVEPFLKTTHTRSPNRQLVHHYYCIHTASAPRYLYLWMKTTQLKQSLWSIYIYEYIQIAYNPWPSPYWFSHFWGWYGMMVFYIHVEGIYIYSTLALYSSLSAACPAKRRTARKSTSRKTLNTFPLLRAHIYRPAVRWASVLMYAYTYMYILCALENVHRSLWMKMNRCQKTAEACPRNVSTRPSYNKKRALHNSHK